MSLTDRSGGYNGWADSAIGMAATCQGLKLQIPVRRISIFSQLVCRVDQFRQRDSQQGLRVIRPIGHYSGYQAESVIPVLAWRSCHCRVGIRRQLSGSPKGFQPKPEYYFLENILFAGPGHSDLGQSVGWPNRNRSG